MSASGLQIWLWALALFVGLGGLGALLLRLAGRPDPHFARRYALQGALVLAALGPPAVGPVAFCCALGLYAGFSAHEVRTALITRHVVSKSLPFVAASLVFAAGLALLIGRQRIAAPCQALLVVLGFSLPWLFKRSPAGLRDKLAPWLCLAFPAAPIAAATALAEAPASLLPKAAFLYAALEVNDSVAFLAGRAFGKRKLAARLSPHKTWAGFVAGLVSAAAVGALMAFCLPGWPRWLCVLAALALASLGVLADLSASALKRALELKDYGQALGPHGGLLDAYDAWLLVLGVWACVLAVTAGG